MAGSTFGKNFSITTWGEAGSTGIGVVVDGVPAGVELEENEIQAYINRRKPTAACVSTKRHENDYVTINSGISKGITTGAPISMTIMNSALKDKSGAENGMLYRPGQADYSYDAKYGLNDKAVAARAIERENAARVAGGAIATAILKKMGVTFCSYVKSIGPVNIRYSDCSLEALKSSPVNMPDANATKEAVEYLSKLAEEKNSAGGVVEVIVSGIPAGIGEPVFRKLDSGLAAAVMSIDSVKGIEIGDGFEAAQLTGIVSNDAFVFENGVAKKTNHSGGVLGGLSDGSELVLRAAFRPAAAIATEQTAIDSEGNEVPYAEQNPAETAYVPRAAVVVESMMSIALLDLMFDNMYSKFTDLEKFYAK